MHVKAVYEAGAWHYMMFIAELPNNEIVSLIPSNPGAKTTSGGGAGHPPAIASTATTPDVKEE